MLNLHFKVNACMVCVSVCLGVGQTGELCKNGWTDRDAVWGLIHVGPRNYVLDGVEIPNGMGQFWGLFGPLKNSVSLCCSVHSKRDLSILNNGMSVRLLQPTAILATGRCHITLSPVRNSPQWCPFVLFVNRTRMT